MNTLFISDLHLDTAHPAITQLFLDFLQQQAIHADALYILGDFFALWIGDDNHSAFNQTICNALSTLTRAGVPVYFMHGNRDFLIGEKFLQQTGCQLLTDPTVIDLYGTPTLLMHGDTLCTADSSYLKFRRFVHNPTYQRIFLRTPLWLRKAIARLLRYGSERKQHENQMIMDATPAEIIRVMQQHQVSHIIHGHTHRPSIEYFSLDKQTACRIVLSDWHDNYGNVLICQPDGQRRLVNFCSESHPTI